MKLTGLLASLLLLCGPTLAAGMGDKSDRAGKWEAGLLINHVEGWDLNGRNGSRIDVDSDTSWGLSIGYNFDEHFNLSLEFTHNEQSYDARIVPDTPPGPDTEISHELDNDTVNLSFTYHFLARTFTPYVRGGLGWTYLDSNIKSGDIDSICWWDPWWGYICSSYYSTYSDSSFGYSVGAGLRWEASRDFALTAGADRKWVSVDAVNDEAEITVVRIALLWIFR